jgi:hypothetical protein
MFKIDSSFLARPTIRSDSRTDDRRSIAANRQVLLSGDVTKNRPALAAPHSLSMAPLCPAEGNEWRESAWR